MRHTRLDMTLDERLNAIKDFQHDGWVISGWYDGCNLMRSKDDTKDGKPLWRMHWFGEGFDAVAKAERWVLECGGKLAYDGTPDDPV